MRRYWVARCSGIFIPQVHKNENNRDAFAYTYTKIGYHFPPERIKERLDLVQGLHNFHNFGANTMTEKNGNINVPMAYRDLHAGISLYICVLSYSWQCSKKSFWCKKQKDEGF